MNVGELKELLDLYPDNLEVGFAYGSGDYWRTTLVGKVDDAETRKVEYSVYHRTLKLLDEDDENPATVMLVLL